MANRVLIAGASGLVGYAAVRHFATLPGWEAVGVSRRLPVGLPEEAELLSVDLLDEGGVRAGIRGDVGRDAPGVRRAAGDPRPDAGLGSTRR